MSFEATFPNGTVCLTCTCWAHPDNTLCTHVNRPFSRGKKNSAAVTTKQNLDRVIVAELALRCSTSRSSHSSAVEGQSPNGTAQSVKPLAAMRYFNRVSGFTLPAMRASR